MRNCSTLNRCTTRRSAKCHNVYRKDTSEEEKPDLLKPASQRSIDGVAMGTGVSTHMEVMGCWKSCRAERNHLEGPFCLWLWWTALKKKQQPTNVNVESAGGKLWRHTVVRRLDGLLSAVAVCGAIATFSPTLHDACSTCVDASLPPGTVMSICTYAAAAELHFRPKHPQNTNCC